MNSRLNATERTTNACRKGRNAFYPINGINGKTMRVSQIISICRLTHCLMRLLNVEPV